VNVEIRDAAAVRALRPLEVASYLRSKKWVEKRTTATATCWELTNDGGSFEAAVPLDEEVRDYALRMGDVLHAIAAAEERSQQQVHTDLLTTFADVVRVRIDDPEAKDGTLALDAHAEIAQKTRDLLLAAGCSAVQKRAVWHASKPTQAVEQVKKLRVGQSERGSYIITVISRVSPALEYPAGGRLFEAEIPFERKLIHTLACSLAALDTAAARAAVSGKFDSFEESVERGVSANLCDAVAGLWGENAPQRVLEFRFSWSPARPLESEAPSQVRFGPDRIPLIRDAARAMKERAPVPDFDLEGAVVKLEQLPEAETVLSLVDGHPKRVAVVLDSAEYKRAVEAHKLGHTFRCRGSLVREGRGYALQSPRDITVRED
jgi:hypothetical protein